MGTWGYGPLDNDIALDTLGLFGRLIEKDNEYYLDIDPEELKERLEALTLEEIQNRVKEEKYGYLKKNRYVIPVFYFQNGAYPKDKALRDYLFESIDYHECVNGFSQTLTWLKLFKENFDDLLSGKATIEDFKLVKLFGEDKADDFVIENDIVKKYRGKDTVVIIPNGIKEIGKNAFMSKSRITKVVLPESLIKIGDSAFCECKKLETINFPDGLQCLGRRAFALCESLKEALLPETVKDIQGGVFFGCSKLEKVVLPRSLKKIASYTFQNCKLLKEVKLPEGLVSIGENAFSGCESLEEIKFPDSLLEIGGRAFAYCNLKNVYISDKIKKIEHGSEFQFDNNKSINIVFDEKRTDYSFENGLLFNRDKTMLYKNVSNSEEVLTLPEGLKKVSVQAFFKPTNKKIIFSSTVEECDSAIYLNCYSDGYSDPLEEVVFNDGICFTSDSVITLTNFHLFNIRKLKRIVLPKHFTFKKEFPFTLFIDICDFSQCECLTYENQLVLNNDKTIIYGGHKDINETLIIPDTVEEIQSKAFMMCRIKNVVWSKNLKKLGDGCFYGNHFEEATLPTTTKEIPADAFYGCRFLKKVSIPNNITKIGPGAFDNCSELEMVYLPDSIKTIESRAFNETGIKEITIPGSLKVITSWSFAFCEKLEKVVLNEGIEKIESDAFICSRKIKEVVLPKSIKTVAKDAFDKGVKVIR